MSENDLSPSYEDLPADVHVEERRTKNPNMGAPRASIDFKQLIKLAELGASMEEMAQFFNVHKSTISRRYRDVIAQAKAGTKMKLRARQLQAAMDGDKTMLVWLGKQMLGQSDNGERSSDENKPLPWNEDLDDLTVDVGPEPEYDEEDGD
jgi:hypothetical protein